MTPLWVAWVALTISGGGTKGQVIPEGRQCLYAATEPGWKCSSGSPCINLKYVCDSYVQCLHDDSDESEGCYLYPGTGCKAWGGKKHVKCPDSEQCVEDGRQEEDCLKEDSHPESRICAGDPNLWRCDDGQCVSRSLVCDTLPKCSDKSDEMLGCQLFPETECKSYFGLMHERCVDWSMGYESIVCTLPEFIDAGECRNCSDPDQWRCDNGWCISRSKVQDGVPDCTDGSDEARPLIKWWAVFVFTLVVTLAGMLTSFCYRLFLSKKSLFFCGWCKSQKAARLIKMERQISDTVDTVDSAVGAFSNGRTMTASKELILPLNLINILDNEGNWKKKSLRRGDEEYGKHLYAKVHQQPDIYRNLYQYIGMRYDKNGKKFKRISDQVFRWEMDFHSDDTIEVVKCWRLHLGSNELYRDVCLSQQEPSSADQFISSYWVPIRNWGRNQRKAMPKLADRAYTCMKWVSFSVKPFLSVSLLYFEHFKNITFLYLIWTTLYDMMGGDIFGVGVEFEANLVICLLMSFVLAHVCFAIISAYFAEDIFELSICDHKVTSLRDKIFLKLFAVILHPFLPAFLLANHSFYEERVASLKRDLQTHDMFEHDKSQLEETLQQYEDETDGIGLLRIGKTTATFAQCRGEILEKIFVEIQKFDVRSKLHARIYSCFRVVHGVIVSSAMITSLVLILIVTSIPGRRIMLMNGVSTKIGDFLSFKRSHQGASGGNILESLNMATDVIFLGSMTFSSVMLLTALTRYVYNAKVKNMTIKGQVFLSLYFGFHMVSRVTVFVVLFSTSEISKIIVSSKNGTEAQKSVYSMEAVSTLSSVNASIISAVLILLHLLVLYAYNLHFIKGFRRVNFVQQFVHVLINCLVAVPFKLPDVLKPTKDEDLDEVRFDRGPEGDPVIQRRRSDTSIATLAFAIHEKQNGRHKKLRACKTEYFCSTSQLRSSDPGPIWKEFPDVSRPLTEGIGHLREHIEKLWWNNPEDNLRISTVKKRLPQHLLASVKEEHIESTFMALKRDGFINKRLFNPRRTRLEYFWLFLIHLMFNTMALILEITTGGIKTKSGSYFSWDVRFGTFFLGLLCLGVYYKRYHASRDLIVTPLPCCLFCHFGQYLCCRQGTLEEPVQAIPDDEEMQRCLENPDLPDCKRVVSKMSNRNSVQHENEGEEEKSQSARDDEKDDESEEQRCKESPQATTNAKKSSSSSD